MFNYSNEVNTVILLARKYAEGSDEIKLSHLSSAYFKFTKELKEDPPKGDYSKRLPISYSVKIFLKALPDDCYLEEFYNILKLELDS